MTDDLGGVVRGIAREEGAAAELDRPYSAALRDRYVRDVRRRRAAGVGALALVTAVVVGGGALGADRLAHDLPPVDEVVADPTPSWTPSPTWEPTPSDTPTETPTATPTETPTPTEAPTTPPPAPEPEPEPEPEPSTPPPPPPPAPSAPTGLVAHPGGGSGEVYLWFDTVPGATGYRVYRSLVSADGPFDPAGSFDVATGALTIEYPGWQSHLEMRMVQESETTIEYYESMSMQFVWLRATAFNAGGESPLSGVTCAKPQNGLSPEVSEC